MARLAVCLGCTICLVSILGCGVPEVILGTSFSVRSIDSTITRVGDDAEFLPNVNRVVRAQVSIHVMKPFDRSSKSLSDIIKIITNVDTVNMASPDDQIILN